MNPNFVYRKNSESFIGICGVGNEYLQENLQMKAQDTLYRPVYLNGHHISTIAPAKGFSSYWISLILVLSGNGKYP